MQLQAGTFIGSGQVRSGLVWSTLSRRPSASATASASASLSTITITTTSLPFPFPFQTLSLSFAASSSYWRSILIHPSFQFLSRRRCSTNTIMPEKSLTLSESDITISPKKQSQVARITPTGGDPLTGKYRWPDGCVYQGEWNKGRPCGKGTFSWPSGATYSGHFLSGRVHGLGTFSGVHGDTYHGSWLSDRKHGFGHRRYSNGDLYHGLWHNNLQHGHGTYVWANGDRYSGDWHSGSISGKGVLVWANGSRYQGSWENGVPKGEGFFTLSSGNDANWGNNIEEDEQSLPRKRHSVDGFRNVNLPRICIWELDGEAGDITCDIVDSTQASMLYNMVPTPGDLQRSPCWPEIKKPGQTISKGHKNYDLMLNVQLGIRYSVGKHASILQQLKVSDFDPKEKFWTRFPPEGSKFTPPHQSVDFRWKDYCPVVFRHLRGLFGIDPANYMLAICGSDALRELSSPGKSGSLFYLTQDDRFMIKTVKKSEVKVLIKMLQSYYQHVYQYKNSLITKFLGVHCVKPVGGQKTRFVVMGNLFCSEYRIHRRFDLKGSSYGRTTDKPEGGIDETTTLKDLDLNFVFHLEPSWFQELIWQIDRDCEFLESERIMDYSLLIGMHFRDDTGGETKMPPSDTHTGKKTHDDEKLLQGCHIIKAGQNLEWILENQGSVIRLGANMPARAERVQRGIQVDLGSNSKANGGEMVDVVLYFGVIDILQDYDITKKIEHAYKSLQVDSTSISAVDPKLYSKRFRDFIHRIFVEER